MRILFTISSMHNGGAERILSYLANGMASDNDDVYILLIGTNMSKTFYELNKKVKLISLYSRDEIVTHGVDRINRINKKIRLINPDVVISFLPQVSIYTYFAIRKLKCKFIVSERNDPHKYNLLTKILLRFVFLKADGCVFQTKDAKKWYFGKNNSIKSAIISNPFPSPLKNKIPRDKKVFVTTARFVPQKNLFFLVRLFNEFLKLDRSFELHIYGDGPLKGSLYSYIKKRHLDNNIFLLGNDPNWIKNEVDSRFYIMTSKFEGMPNALIEALVNGMVCLSSDCPIGGPKELSFIFENLVLFKNKNFKSALSKIEKIINLEPKQAYYNKEYSINSIVRRWKCFITGKIYE